MGSYQKADGITLSQLNNTEYTNFMNRVLTLLTAGSISKLTVTNIVNSIKPKSDKKPGETRSVKKLAITTFQNTTLIFTEDEIDIDATVKLLK